MNFEEIIKKIVNAKAKIGLKSTIIVQNSDFYCF